MTPNTDSALARIFDTDLTGTDLSVTEMKIAATNEATASLEQQREYVKKNIVSLLEKGETALDEMMAIAKSNEAGKDYKVVIEMVKTLVDSNVQLLDAEVAHRDQGSDDDEDGEPTKGAKRISNTQNNTTVFVGSTAELSKHLRERGPNSSDIIENKS